MFESPEDAGIELADSLDKDAFNEEKGNIRESELDEIKKAFEIQFKENQLDIQSELLRMAQEEYGYENKDQSRELARDFARTAFKSYANTLSDDHEYTYSDIPYVENNIFNFRF